MSEPTFLNLNGIPTPKVVASPEQTFWFDPQGVWRLLDGDFSGDFDILCVRIHEALERAIQKGVDPEQWSIQKYMLPQFVSTAGLNAESTTSRDQFEQLLKIAAPHLPDLNRFLYLYDCEVIVSSIQECMKEILQTLGNFYMVLNLEPLFYPVMEQPDGIRMNTSPTVTRLFADVSFIYLRLHSLLDYTVKLAVEAEGLRAAFGQYPRLVSRNDQYGERRKVSFNGAAGTVFESCDFIGQVETIRNLIIHDGMLDDMPKCYEHIEGGNAVERFILFPDMTGRIFDSFRNRRRFFHNEDKINLRLPEVVKEFARREMVTLERVLEILYRKA